MSSPITLSGFNNVDFSLIIDAILEQERAPIQRLESSKFEQQSRLSAYGDLESRLSALDAARSSLADSGAFQAFSTTAADDTLLSASAGVGATEGSHSIEVTSLAKAQVLATSATVSALDTVVADAGTLTIGGRDYAVSSDTTLVELRDQINADTDRLASASIVDTGAGLRLALTARSTGTAAAFTVTNGLTLGGGASGIAFADTDTDGVSGDSAADNAVVASDASLLVDGIAVTSATNSVSGALAGVTLDLTGLGTTTLDVATDTSSIKEKISDFVDAYNDFSLFMQQQFSVGGGPAGPLAGDFIGRQASSEIRQVLRGSGGGGAFGNLVEIGISFDRTGSLTIDDAVLQDALESSPSDVETLFRSETGDTGILDRMDNALQGYLGSSGLLTSVEERIDDAIGSLNQRIATMEERLVLREQELRQQFTAADQAISSLNAQMDSLGAIG